MVNEVLDGIRGFKLVLGWFSPVCCWPG